MQLGTIISAHGCWQYLKKAPLENGEMAEFLRRDLEESVPTSSISYKEKEIKGSIRLQHQYVEEEFIQRVGFWGYLMQITYQVGQTLDSNFPPHSDCKNCYLMMCYSR